VSTGYYLLDHPNPHGPHHYASRKAPVLACVVHITAGLQGKPAGADSSAEQTARYAATTDRPVSWHSGSDRDSHLRLLPDSHTAFQCQGYNSCTIGHEISKRDTSWADEDPGWVTDTLQMAAACLRPRLADLGIPIRLATRGDLDREKAKGTAGRPVGLLSHAVLDPTRRTDPGPDFPWDRFLTLLRDQEDDDMSPDEVRAIVRTEVRAAMSDLYDTLVTGDQTHTVTLRRAVVAAEKAADTAAAGGVDQHLIADRVASELAERLARP
jgi:hypothetical protein